MHSGYHHRINRAVPIGGVPSPGSSLVLFRASSSRSRRGISYSLTMISVKISSGGKPLPLARGLPTTIELKDGAKVSDVKVAVAAKFPKVGQTAYFTCHDCETDSP